MTMKKRDRKNINFRILRTAFDALSEMAERENRSMTSLLEVMIMDAYDNWRGNALGRQPRPDADRQTDSKQAGG